MSPPKVVVAGLGDTGLLTAIHLSRHAEVVGVSSKPGLLSGQELGLRLTRPTEWGRDYWIGFDRYRRLDRVRTVHGAAIGLDPDRQLLRIRLASGTEVEEHYDQLVIATGVRNGFWRRPHVQDAAEIDDLLREEHQQIAAAGSVMVVGGGAAAVSAAANIAATWPEKRVDLYFPGAHALTGHHPRVWRRLERRLVGLGVGLHPGHRAVVPDPLEEERIGTGAVSFGSGRDPATADAVIWAIGRVRPNTAWIPGDLLDADGFVRVDEHLRVPGRPEIFAIGDVAASDPLRTSARSRADHLLAGNVLAAARGRRLRRFTPAKRRWGSVIGTQDDVLEVFAPTGHAFRLRPWSRLQPWLVGRAIYKGVRAG